MMRTVPYMVFRYRYSSNEYLEKPDSTGYLFYDPSVRRLYLMPQPASLTESADQRIHPIRYLSNATLFGQNIHIVSHYDFTHNKTVRKLLSDKYPGPLKLDGFGEILAVNHENYHVFDHFYSGTWVGTWGENCGLPRYQDWRCCARAHLERARTPAHHKRWLRQPLGFHRSDDTELTEPFFETMIPDHYYKRQIWEFRNVALYPTQRKQPGFIITETELKTDGRSKKGILTRWIWASGNDTRTLKFGPFKVNVKTEEPNTCLLENEKQSSPQQLYLSSDRLMRRLYNESNP